HSGPSTAPHQRSGDTGPRPGRRSRIQPPRRCLDRPSGARGATQRDGHPRIRWRVLRRGRLSMTKLPACVVFCAALTTACDIGEQPHSYMIAGPSVLSTGPTLTPYVWDTREELANRIENPVARGPLLLDGTGLDAVIKINRADQAWVARGPDLSPAVTGVRTLGLRYRWRPDSSLPATATQ